jgi:hypothetical protein
MILLKINIPIKLHSFNVKNIGTLLRKPKVKHRGYEYTVNKTRMKMLRRIHCLQGRDKKETLLIIGQRMIITHC